ncbi:filamentous growth, cell polarity and elongation [Scheffersomyces xylosifermentans]|uniref:filamentous growth, cell polarity and elongation n=1 Tax=Scheffersomyces xylosifermentans TaxID=1304137 RepID=UPI00315D7CC3
MFNYIPRIAYVVTALSSLSMVTAINLDINNKSSVCDAAKIVMNGALNYYEGLKYGGTVGMFAPPNYWWNAGEAFGGIVDYFSFCDSNNKTLESLIMDAMYHQAGENFNYVPSNQSMTEGNDDQGVWAMAIMQAVERNFTNPESHSWLELTIAAFNTMNSRWDTEHCNGGLRWQIFSWNSGYDYKNSIANGCLFHLAARLARYLDNDTYAQVAEKVWDWMVDVGFLVDDTGNVTLYDGADISTNCTDLTKKQWSYTYGIFMAGAAYMYDYNQDNKWLKGATDLVDTSSWFFENDIMVERQCFFSKTCNNDQRSFRSLFSRCLGLTSLLVNSTHNQISTWIQTSAKGAAASCNGGTDGVTCGQDWSKGTWDGIFGLGEQTGALEVINAVIVTTPDKLSQVPKAQADAVMSSIDFNSGLGSQDNVNLNEITVTGKDKAGAGALTAIVLAIILAGGIWMVL